MGNASMIQLIHVGVITEIWWKRNLHLILCAAIAKYHKPSCSKNRKVWTRGETSEIKLPAGPCSLWSSWGQSFPWFFLCFWCCWQSVTFLGYRCITRSSPLCSCFCVKISLFLQRQKWQDLEFMVIESDLISTKSLILRKDNFCGPSWPLFLRSFFNPEQKWIPIQNNLRESRNFPTEGVFLFPPI